MGAGFSQRLEAVKSQRLEEVVSKLGQPPAGPGKHRCRMKCHPWDNTPSMHVYDNNSFYCFGCKTGGSCVDYVMGVEGIGLWEAVRRIEEMFNLRVIRGGDTRSRLADDMVRRVRDKFTAAAFSTGEYSVLVEGRLREFAEREGGWPLPDAVWVELARGYAELDRCVTRGAPREDLDDLLAYYLERVELVAGVVASVTEASL